MSNLFVRTKTKIFFVFSFLFFLQAKSIAQNVIEVVIVASSHSNAKGNYRPIIDKLKRFAPDMVFGEYLSPDDLKALDDSNASKKGYADKYQLIQRRNPPAAKNISKKISEAQSALARFPYYHQTRMELAANYVLNYDRGNAEYQFFVLETYMKDKLGKEESKLYQKKFGGTDSLRKVRLLRERTEYHNIFFPLVYELKHDQIYPMDCQKYDAPWNEAWAIAGVQVKAMEQKAKADSTSPEAQTVKSIKQYYVQIDSAARAANLKDGYELLNSALYAKWDAAQNFYGGEAFYGAPGFPTGAIKAMIEQWNLRNTAMCENIVRQAKEKGAKKVVVGVGASHRKWMEEIFNRLPEVKVTNFNALP